MKCSRHILILFSVFILLSLNSCTPEQIQQREEPKHHWQLEGIAVPGNYADPEIVDLKDGRFRLYYSIEPDVPGNKLELFSSVSSDGISWSKEEGIRKEFATFPDVVRLPNGQFRMYFQNSGVIKSAISEDGLKWIDENGVRITADEEGFAIDNVGAQTTMLLDDGTYIMVYRATINERYSPRVPNSITSLFFYATSTDGLYFEKKGIALDSRNAVFEGWLDGAEFVEWDDELRLYFWSYKGIYHILYKDGAFSKEKVLDISASANAQNSYPGFPPADPTLAKIGDIWMLFYGQHQNGIYYATLS